MLCSSPYSAGPSGARRVGHTSCVGPGFYRQLPPCMSSRHRSLNPVLRDVAAKRPHVEGFFSNASFRSYVRYIMDVMIVFARHCVLKPMRTPIHVHLHTERAFLISPSKGMPVGKRESMHQRDCAKVFRDASRLSESEHLLRTSHCCGHHFLTYPYRSLYLTRLWSSWHDILQGYI